MSDFSCCSTHQGRLHCLNTEGFGNWEPSRCLFVTLSLTDFSVYSGRRRSDVSALALCLLETLLFLLCSPTHSRLYPHPLQHESRVNIRFHIIKMNE